MGSTILTIILGVGGFILIAVGIVGIMGVNQGFHNLSQQAQQTALTLPIGAIIFGIALFVGAYLNSRD